MTHVVHIGQVPQNRTSERRWRQNLVEEVKDILHRHEQLYIVLDKSLSGMSDIVLVNMNDY